jgi:sialidase-1
LIKGLQVHHRAASLLLFAFCLPPSGAGQVAFLEQVDLFTKGDAGVHTYRIPALIETAKGTLIAVADARHDNDRDLPGRMELVIRRSSDRGKIWSATKTLRKVAEGGVGDASLLLDSGTGRIWCFHAYGPPGIGFPTAKAGERTGNSTLQIHAMFSDDDGQSWSEPVDLTPQIKEPAWQAVFATSGTHIETSKHRYLIPLVVKDDRGTVSARNSYSDDGGKTWKAGAAIGSGTDESKAIELKDGTILQNLRHGKVRSMARSKDGGATFGALEQDPALIDAICNAGLVRYQHKGSDLLVFTNAASTKRENLTVKVSPDEGKTWPYARTLHAGPAAYSTVIALGDGTLGVLYEGGDSSSVEKITFARFNLEWVKAARPR